MAIQSTINFEIGSIVTSPPLIMSFSQTTYPVMEHFATIQGEGVHAGSAAYFIRLGGCDVGCHWCDVKESWPINAHKKMTIEEILSVVQNSNLSTVVITGGEPTMHNLDALTTALRVGNIHCHIETSGTHPLTGHWDWVTFSPKKFKAPILNFGKLASELKVVVFNISDFDFALLHAQSVSDDCKLYLQPEWDKRELMMPQIVQFVKEKPNWKISMQTHKYMQIP